MAFQRSFSTAFVLKNSGAKLQNVRGTHDLFPAQMLRFQEMIETMKRTVETFNFSEISTPILESSELFERSLGEDSDVVSKEMYIYSHPNSNEKIALRPEGTAGIMRAFLNAGRSLPLPQKYYYYGPMFRRERPQQGRLRQFHQFGVEFLGSSSEYSDLETIEMAHKVLSSLQLSGPIELQINSLGDIESRKNYRKTLQNYFEEKKSMLSETSKLRLNRGSVLRILDSKENEDKTIIKNAPSLIDFLSPSSLERYKNIRHGLTILKIPFVENPTLVRGLDYYNETIFEFVSSNLGSQGTVLAGGRYDQLAHTLSFGGKSIPGVGWASGLERLLLLTKQTPSQRKSIAVINTVNSSIQSESIERAFQVSQLLRNFGLPVFSCFEFDGSKQLAKALNSNCSHVIFIKDASETVTLKNLESKKEANFSISELNPSLISSL